VFFSLPEYREAVRNEWEALPPPEARVWKAFLGSKGYNTEDSYLTVNEFQSYLFQQDETKVAGYQATILTALLHSFPALAGDIAAVKARKPSSFLASFRPWTGASRPWAVPGRPRDFYQAPGLKKLSFSRL